MALPKSRVYLEESGNLSSGEYYLLKLLLESLGGFKILLIEEPEISLHPEWQAKIIGILRHSLIGEKQIFIVTQSPYAFSKPWRYKCEIVYTSER